MDLAQLDTAKKSNEGVWLDILSPYQTMVVAKFRVAGRDSKVLKRRQQELAKKRNTKKKISPIEEEQDTIETISICTLEWDSTDDDGNALGVGTLLVDGKQLECDFENAKLVYGKYTWIAEQVVEFIAERSNFL